MEWLLLAVFIPALVVPVVVLWGYAGCGFSNTVPIRETPINVAVAPTGATRLTVTWEETDMVAAVSAQLERVREGESTATLFAASDPAMSSSLDTGLVEDTTYFYRVRSTGPVGNTSEFSSMAQGRTLPFQPAFTANLHTDANNLEGNCIVVRIEPSRLARSGSEIRMTIRSGPGPGLRVSSVFVSRVNAQSTKLYDSAADLTLVANNVAMGSDETLVLPPVDYELDASQALLVAFDIATDAGFGNIRRQTQGVVDVRTFRRPNTAQAGVATRDNGFQEELLIPLVHSIEVP